MPSPMMSALMGAIAGAVTVSAHGHITLVTAGGKSYEGFDPTSAPYGPQPDSVTWYNEATDNGFVLSSALQNPDIICHLAADNAALTAPVAAGEDVTLQWNEWPESHHGPVIDYMADCGGDCTTVDKSSLKWFKIQEMGQLELGSGAGQTGRWASDLLIENGASWTTNIPADLKEGNYVLRHEIIALHEGGTEGKAQMYPQCVNLKVTGGGSATPSGVAGTELYTSTEDGIMYNIYNDEANPTYLIPGPKLYSGGSGAGNGNGGDNTTPVEPTPTASEPEQPIGGAPTATPTILPAPVEPENPDEGEGPQCRRVRKQRGHGRRRAHARK